MLGQLELAYYAGLFDGEGSIGIMKHKSKTCNRRTRFELNVQLCSADEWIVQSLGINFGGSICLIKSGFTDRRTIWHWMITARQALSFLEQIHPYLRLKREQAEIAIKFQRRKKWGNFAISDEQHAVEEAERILIHAQTRKGRKLDVPNL